MKHIPNLLSLSRMILSIMLIWCKPLSIAFLTIYLLCVLSDILDGLIARISGTTSSFGSRLDSAADFMMMIIVMLLLLPLIPLKASEWIWIASIATVRFLSFLIVYKKFHTFGIIHTFANKITGMILVSFPILYVSLPSAKWIYLCCAIASISAIEELCIHLSSDKLHLDQKSLFLK